MELQLIFNELSYLPLQQMANLDKSYVFSILNNLLDISKKIEKLSNKTVKIRINRVELATTPLENHFSWGSITYFNEWLGSLKNSDEKKMIAKILSNKEAIVGTTFDYCYKKQQSRGLEYALLNHFHSISLCTEQEWQNSILELQHLTNNNTEIVYNIALATHLGYFQRKYIWKQDHQKISKQNFLDNIAESKTTEEAYQKWKIGKNKKKNPIFLTDDNVELLLYSAIGELKDITINKVFNLYNFDNETNAYIIFESDGTFSERQIDESGTKVLCLQFHGYNILDENIELFNNPRHQKLPKIILEKIRALNNK